VRVRCQSLATATAVTFLILASAATPPGEAATLWPASGRSPTRVAADRASTLDPSTREEGGAMVGDSRLPTSTEATQLTALRPTPPGFTELISRTNRGGFPDAPSSETAVSADGRFVAFASVADDLVPGDAPGSQDLFVFDRQNQTTVRLPLPLPPLSQDILPGGRAGEPAVSAHGEVVAFTYVSPGATGPVVLAWDRRSGETGVVSWLLGDRPTVSADGRYIAFESTAEITDDELPPGVSQVYRYDRLTGETILVSRGPGGVARSGSGQASISADGDLVVFATAAQEWGAPAGVPGAVGPGQVYLRQISTGTTELVSRRSDGAAGNGASDAPSISADGRLVAFRSQASDLVRADRNGVADVFVLNRQTGAVLLVSAGVAGDPANGPSGAPSISADGDVVAFLSQATNLTLPFAGSSAAQAPASGAIAPQVYARRLSADQTILISATPAGTPAGGASSSPATDAGGGVVAFVSSAPDLLPGDDNSAADAFVRRLPPALRADPPRLDFDATALGAPPAPRAVTVTNDGWSPATVRQGRVRGDGGFAITLDGCRSARLDWGSACTVSLVFVPPAVGPRTATLEMVTDQPGPPLTVPLAGEGGTQVLLLSPTVGPPGTVVRADGQGFPPGASLVLSWRGGITAQAAPITVGPSGAFQAWILVLPNDRLGPRRLEAALPGGKPLASAPFLVVADTVQPPRFALLVLAGALPAPLLVRR
jgi:Tol biopolymer transport system component